MPTTSMSGTTSALQQGQRLHDPAQGDAPRPAQRAGGDERQRGEAEARRAGMPSGLAVPSVGGVAAGDERAERDAEGLAAEHGGEHAPGELAGGAVEDDAAHQSWVFLGCCGGQ